MLESNLKLSIMVSSTSSYSKLGLRVFRERLQVFDLYMHNSIYWSHATATRNIRLIDARTLKFYIS